MGQAVVIPQVPPTMAFLNEEFKKAFENPMVEFVQANLANPGMMMMMAVQVK